MNTLSWLIYFAGLTEGLMVVTGIAGVLLFGFRGFIFLDDDSSFNYESNFSNRLKWWLVSLAIMFIIIAVFTPSEDTVYMIIASEFGEEIINMPETQEVFNKGYDKLLEILE